MEEMGRRSAEILLDMVRHKGPHACELLPTTLQPGPQRGRAQVILLYIFVIYFVYPKDPFPASQ